MLAGQTSDGPASKQRIHQKVTRDLGLPFTQKTRLSISDFRAFWLNFAGPLTDQMMLNLAATNQEYICDWKLQSDSSDMPANRTTMAAVWKLMQPSKKMVEKHLTKAQRVWRERLMCVKVESLST